MKQGAGRVPRIHTTHKWKIGFYFNYPYNSDKSRIVSSKLDLILSVVHYTREVNWMVQRYGSSLLKKLSLSKIFIWGISSFSRCFGSWLFDLSKSISIWTGKAVLCGKFMWTRWCLHYFPTEVMDRIHKGLGSTERKPANWEMGLTCAFSVIGSHTKDTSDGRCLLIITKKQTNKTTKEGTLR